MNANQTKTQIPNPRRGGAPDEISPLIQIILNKIIGILLDELINVNNEVKEINEEWEKVMR